MNNSKGIYLYTASSNTITDNDISHNSDAVLVVLGSSPGSNNITYNNITHNTAGITLDCSSDNIIRGNAIANNTKWGIAIEVTYGGGLLAANSIEYNNVANNTWGILLDNDVLESYPIFSTSIRCNDITTNQYGIKLDGRYVHTNEIYHNNFVNNTYQVSISKSTDNTWDDGWPSGGNYWSDYTGMDEFSGSDQDEPGWDGIGDTLYVIDENNVDNYPLMNPWPLALLEVETWVIGNGDFKGPEVGVNGTEPYQASPANFLLTPGSYSIEVESPYCEDGPYPGSYYKYTFDHWEDSSTDNPRTIQLDEDKVLKAWYWRKLYFIWGPQP